MKLASAGRLLLTACVSRSGAPMASVTQSGASSATATPSSLRLLTQAEAIAVDEALMATPGFSLDQLMELAGEEREHGAVVGVIALWLV